MPLHEIIFDLHTADGEPITAYGKTCMYVNVGLRKTICKIYIIVDVSMLIIGVNLPQHHDLPVDKRTDIIKRKY